MVDLGQSDGLDEWEDVEGREPVERRPRRGQKSPDSKVQGAKLQSRPGTVEGAVSAREDKWL